MAITQIRGNTQIMDATITAAKFVSSLGLTTAQLADGATFIRSGGSIPFLANQSMGGFNLQNLATPVLSTDAVTLSYAQSLINGVAIKPSTRGVYITNLALLQGGVTVDGLTLATGDRVLLTAQTTASQNGPWVVQSATTTTAWTRPTDFASGSTQKEGILIIVAEGTLYAHTKWLCISTGVITVDTTATSWLQDLSGTNYTTGNGITLVGAAFSVRNGNAITFDGSQNVTILPNGTSLNVSAAGLKISDGTPGQIQLAGATNAYASTTVSGDVTISSAGATTVNTTYASGYMKYTANVYNETVGGVPNGTLTTFTTVTAAAVLSLELFQNGLMLEPGAGNDYTVSGTTITMLLAPNTGDKLRAYYIK